MGDLKYNFTDVCDSPMPLDIADEFCYAVHDCKDLPDSEKLVYLRSAVKDGTARNTIEGLSWSGEFYMEVCNL